MPDLLLEIFCEEIPARMQAQAARDLERMAGEQLAAAGLKAQAMRAYAGPRRLTLAAEGLPAYDQVLKSSHLFNLMDARGAIAVAERQSYIGRIRDLTKACAQAWVDGPGA